MDTRTPFLQNMGFFAALPDIIPKWFGSIHRATRNLNNKQFMKKKEL
jgi:hypothetical protein